MRCKQCDEYIKEDEEAYWENEDGEVFCSERCLDEREQDLADQQEEQG